MMAALGREDVLVLLRDRLVAVLGVPPEEVTEAARFDEDLHADSLDLVEVVEGVERRLAERDVDVVVSESDLAGVRTVSDAVDRIVAAARHG